MSGQMKKYKESLKTMPEPICLSEIQKKLDLRGLMDYARLKGKKVVELSESEKAMFLQN